MINTNELKKLATLKTKIKKATKNLDLETKIKTITELKHQTTNNDFWQDHSQAEQIMSQINELQKIITSWQDLNERAHYLYELSTEKLNVPDEQIWHQDLEQLNTDFNTKKILSFLKGKYDSGSAIITITAGTGGDDAEDWVRILLEMYLHYCENQGYKNDILIISSNEQNGIKKVSFETHGSFAYGYLRHERGSHRLVRLSPFKNSDSRQTSFALIEVLPIIQDNNLKLNPKDLKIATYRASGKGGQHVNKTDSAVRITHLPTNISAACQSQRSQLQNKNKALQIISAKLWAQMTTAKSQLITNLKGDNTTADFGSAIRSYIIHPYHMVKDHRTGVNTTNTQAVFNGDITSFIESAIINDC